ncbi:hypothetical protein M2311_003701 [Rhizobium leguminosarum]|uniref:hypothetical protein n=1 Tax=Rhizobium leguminosarum TaxID=384 RepID=UPI001442467C|nr:hypothetical protein [Rhizobium leguminosarum]MDH6273611.1 hypothetical protein [Rhizobium leguminosarum]NKK01038.1 hypothetical protein [Rhizobium leguminosarum bv. viciae]
MIATTEVASVADEESNDFRTWMKSLGYNAKQVSNAGEVVGMSPSLAGHSSRGLRELSYTERLAMAAATAGLPAWTPEKADEIETVRILRRILSDEIAAAQTGVATQEEAMRTIKALIRSEAYRIASESRSTNAADSETDQAILALLRAAVQGTSAR